MTEPQPDARWHLDRRVPIALIVAMALQTGGLVWWAASLNERVNTLERDARTTAPQAERIVRLETRMETILEGISEIKRLLRKD